MLGQSGYADSREDALLDAIIGRRPDGIVLTGIMHSAEGRRRLLAAGIPVVETWDLTPTPLDMLVGFSHAEVGARGGRLPARARAAAGWRWWPATTSARSRRHQAFQRRGARRRACARCALIYVPAPTTLKSGRSALAELLAGARAASTPCSAAPTCWRWA